MQLEGSLPQRLKPRFFFAGFNVRAKQAAEKLRSKAIRKGFVTGHDFSRAANAAISTWALAPASLFSHIQIQLGLFPQPV
jgi:hypothetical protein